MSYYISPNFLDKVAVHVTKNFLNLPGVRVPLILGIHGRKGEGKTFQTELVFRRMGFEPVMISGGELESPDGGRSLSEAVVWGCGAGALCATKVGAQVAMPDRATFDDFLQNSV